MRILLFLFKYICIIKKELQSVPEGCVFKGCRTNVSYAVLTHFLITLRSTTSGAFSIGRLLISDHKASCRSDLRTLAWFGPVGPSSAWPGLLSSLSPWRHGEVYRHRVPPSVSLALALTRPRFFPSVEKVVFSLSLF